MRTCPLANGEDGKHTTPIELQQIQTCRYCNEMGHSRRSCPVLLAEENEDRKRKENEEQKRQENEERKRQEKRKELERARQNKRQVEVAKDRASIKRKLQHDERASQAAAELPKGEEKGFEAAATPLHDAVEPVDLQHTRGHKEQACEECGQLFKCTRGLNIHRSSCLKKKKTAQLQTASRTEKATEACPPYPRARPLHLQSCGHCMEKGHNRLTCPDVLCLSVDETPLAIEGSNYVGQFVLRHFGGDAWMGKVTGWIPGESTQGAIWHVEYGAGDIEALNEQDVAEAAAAARLAGK